MSERSWVDFFETRAFYDYEEFTHKLPLRYFRGSRNIRSVSIDDTRRRRRRRRRRGGCGGCCLKVLLASLVVFFLFFLGAVASLFFLSSEKNRGNLLNTTEPVTTASTDVPTETEKIKTETTTSVQNTKSSSKTNSESFTKKPKTTLGTTPPSFPPYTNISNVKDLSTDTSASKRVTDKHSVTNTEPETTTTSPPHQYSTLSDGSIDDLTFCEELLD
ncbi:Hypothetical predicted protein [Octopus vulgaris]|uniref:Uncharacterized protein n=1 Tax=Octopus vulgaris TaxID=6645 RepID=A0AA36F5H4_OCTVU|nr:Hypothetical predicted protein [Octopus vulgaris]